MAEPMPPPQPPRPGMGGKLPILIFYGAGGLVFLIALVVTVWLATRDTWESDNRKVLMDYQQAAESEEKKGEPRKALGQCKAFEETVGTRVLQDPDLIQKQKWVQERKKKFEQELAAPKPVSVGAVSTLATRPTTTIPLAAPADLGKEFERLQEELRAAVKDNDYFRVLKATLQRRELLAQAKPGQAVVLEEWIKDRDAIKEAQGLVAQTKYREALEGLQKRWQAREQTPQRNAELACAIARASLAAVVLDDKPLLEPAKLKKILEDSISGNAGDPASCEAQVLLAWLEPPRTTQETELRRLEFRKTADDRLLALRGPLRKQAPLYSEDKPYMKGSEAVDPLIPLKKPLDELPKLEKAARLPGLGNEFRRLVAAIEYILPRSRRPVFDEHFLWKRLLENSELTLYDRNYVKYVVARGLLWKYGDGEWSLLLPNKDWTQWEVNRLSLLRWTGLRAETPLTTPATMPGRSFTELERAWKIRELHKQLGAVRAKTVYPPVGRKTLELYDCKLVEDPIEFSALEIPLMRIPEEAIAKGWERSANLAMRPEEAGMGATDAPLRLRCDFTPPQQRDRQTATVAAWRGEALVLSRKEGEEVAWVAGRRPVLEGCLVEVEPRRPEVKDSVDRLTGEVYDLYDLNFPLTGVVSRTSVVALLERERTTELPLLQEVGEPPYFWGVGFDRAHLLKDQGCLMVRTPGEGRVTIPLAYGRPNTPEIRSTTERILKQYEKQDLNVSQPLQEIREDLRKYGRATTGVSVEDLCCQLVVQDRPMLEVFDPERLSEFSKKDPVLERYRLAAKEALARLKPLLSAVEAEKARLKAATTWAARKEIQDNIEKKEQEIVPQKRYSDRLEAFLRQRGRTFADIDKEVADVSGTIKRLNERMGVTPIEPDALKQLQANMEKETRKLKVLLETRENLTFDPALQSFAAAFRKRIGDLRRYLGLVNYGICNERLVLLGFSKNQTATGRQERDELLLLDANGEVINQFYGLNELKDLWIYSVDDFLWPSWGLAPWPPAFDRAMERFEGQRSRRALFFVLATEMAWEQGNYDALAADSAKAMMDAGRLFMLTRAKEAERAGDLHLAATLFREMPCPYFDFRTADRSKVLNQQELDALMQSTKRGVGFGIHRLESRGGVAKLLERTQRKELAGDLALTARAEWQVGALPLIRQICGYAKSYNYSMTAEFRTALDKLEQLAAQEVPEANDPALFEPPKEGGKANWDETAAAKAMTEKQLEVHLDRFYDSRPAFAEYLKAKQWLVANRPELLFRKPKVKEPQARWLGNVQPCIAKGNAVRRLTPLEVFDPNCGEDVAKLWRKALFLSETRDQAVPEVRRLMLQCVLWSFAQMQREKELSAGNLACRLNSIAALWLAAAGDGAVPGPVRLDEPVLTTTARELSQFLEPQLLLLGQMQRRDVNLVLEPLRNMIFSLQGRRLAEAYYDMRFPWFEYSPIAEAYVQAMIKAAKK